LSFKLEAPHAGVGDQPKPTLQGPPDPNAAKPDLRIVSAASKKPFTWIEFEVQNVGKADVGGDTSVTIRSKLSKGERDMPIHRLKAGEKRGYAAILLVDGDQFKPGGAYEGVEVTLDVRMKGAEASTANNSFAFKLGATEDKPEPPKLKTPATQPIPKPADKASETTKLAPKPADKASETVKLAPKTTDKASETVKLAPKTTDKASETTKLATKTQAEAPKPMQPAPAPSRPKTFEPPEKTQPVPSTKSPSTTEPPERMQPKPQPEAPKQMQPATTEPPERMQPKPVVPPVVAKPAPTGRMTGVTSVSRGVSMKPPRMLMAYPSGALLYRSGGDFKIVTDTSVKPGAADMTVTFFWEVDQVARAEGVMWQVARVDYPSFTGGDSDLAPHALVESGVAKGVKGRLELDLGDLAVKAGIEKPGVSGPGVVQLKSGEVMITTERKTRAGRAVSMTRPIGDVARFTAFYVLGGHAAFYVRVIPIAAPDKPVMVGQPSNLIRVYYGDMPPSPPVPLRLPGQYPPKVRLVKFEYRPYHTYCYAHSNPAFHGTDKGGNQDNLLDDIGDFVGDVWNWASTAYTEAKKTVVNVVAGVVPVPRSIIEAALDAALVAAGVPPSIPNLGGIMEGGADYLAEQVIEQVGPPIASDFARDQLKRAILLGAKEASKLGDDPEGTPCRYRTDPPLVLLTLQNTDAVDYEGLTIWSDNAFGPFKRSQVAAPKLRRGQTLTLPLILAPDQRDEFWDGQRYDESKWVAAYAQRQSEISLTLSVKPTKEWTPGDLRVYRSPRRAWGEALIDAR
jgi:hypothetical protein